MQGDLQCYHLASLLWAEPRFNCGVNDLREDVNDNVHAGLPITSTTDENIKAVKKMISDRRITIREVADVVGISFGSCQAIFTDVIGVKCAAEDCSKFTKI